NVWIPTIIGNGLMILRGAQRAAKLYGCKTKAIPELISRASQALELRTCLGIEKPNLIGAVGQSSKFDSDETHGPAVPVLLEEPLQGGQEHGIQMSRFG